MTDLDHIREMLRAELAPIRSELETQRAELASLRADLTSMRPLVDGIPIIHRAVTVIQEDTRSLREDMRVLTAIVHRHDITPPILLDELRGVHAQIARIQGRLDRLEGK